MDWPAWTLAVVLALTVGIMAGHVAGQPAIANDCRYGGSFTSKRTGFVCSKL